MERGLFSPSMFRFFYLAQQPTSRPGASSFTRFLDHTQRYTTVGRTSLDEWSTRRRDLYRTAQYTQNRQLESAEVNVTNVNYIGIVDRANCKVCNVSVRTSRNNDFYKKLLSCLNYLFYIISSHIYTLQFNISCKILQYNLATNNSTSGIYHSHFPTTITCWIMQFNGSLI